LCIHSKVLTKIIREYGSDLEPGRSSDFYEGFVAGLFDTDGSVERNRARIEIAQSDENFLRKLQTYLLFLGIRSTLYSRQMTESKIKGRTIKTKKKPFS